MATGAVYYRSRPRQSPNRLDLLGWSGGPRQLSRDFPDDYSLTTATRDVCDSTKLGAFRQADSRRPKPWSLPDDVEARIRGPGRHVFPVGDRPPPLSPCASCDFGGDPVHPASSGTSALHHWAMPAAAGSSPDCTRGRTVADGPGCPRSRGKRATIVCCRFFPVRQSLSLPSAIAVRPSASSGSR